MQPSVSIKRLRDFDEALIVQLCEKAGEENILPNPRFFEDQKNILFVAWSGSEPAGFLYAYHLVDITAGDDMIFLYSVDVFEPYRRQGIGTALLETLRQLALARYCREIFVLTNRKNTAAMRLYESTGGVREHDDEVMFVYDLTG